MSAKRWKFLSVLLLALSFVLLPFAGARGSSGQFLWLDVSTGYPVKILSDLSGASSPSMAVDASNNAYVCGLKNSAVYLASTSSSWKGDADTPVFSNFSDTDTGCAVALGGGYLYVAGYNGTEIYLKKFDLTGGLKENNNFSPGGTVSGLQMFYDAPNGYLVLAYANDTTVLVTEVNPSDLSPVKTIDTKISASTFKAVLNDGLLVVCGEVEGTPELQCNTVNLGLQDVAKDSPVIFGSDPCNATGNFAVVTDGNLYYAIYTCGGLGQEIHVTQFDSLFNTASTTSLPEISGNVTGTVDAAAYVDGSIALAWSNDNNYYNRWQITDSGYQRVNHQDLELPIPCSYLTPMGANAFACVGSDGTSSDSIYVEYITEGVVDGWGVASIAWNGALGDGDTVVDGVNHDGIVTVLYTNSTDSTKDAWVAQFRNTPKYDLYIGSEELLNSQLFPSEGANVTIRVLDKVCSNETSEVASPDTKIVYYLSKDEYYNDTDKKIGERTVASLNPGECEANAAFTELTISSEDLLSLFKSGDSGYIIACVNKGNETVEINPDNNCAHTASFTVLAANISVSLDAITPDEVEPGSNVTVTITVNNTGGDLAGDSVVKFYLSGCASFNASEATYLGEMNVPSLAPGSTYTEDVQLTIPAKIDSPSSEMCIFAQADANNQVIEDSESDNVAYKSFNLKAPNLKVTSVNVPNDVSYAPGDVVSFNFTIENSGTVDVSSVEWAAYVNNNGDCSSELGTLVAEGTYNGTLEASGSVTVASSFELSEVANTICVVVDPYNSIQETNETDNVGSKTFSLTEKPDLAVNSVVVSPPNLRSCNGDSCTRAYVSFIVENNGLEDAGPFVCSIYLSTDESLSSDDVEIGSTLVEGVKKGASVTITDVPLVIPAGTPDGQYYVLVKADSNNDVDELLENNNVASKQITIGNVSQGSGQAQPVPSGKQIGPANPATAPVQSSNGQISGSFSYQGDVDIVVGFLTCDFSRMYWYDPASGTMTTSFAHSGLVTNLSFSNVALPESNGYLFWLVSPVDVTQLDFSNGAYLLQFYMVGSCD